MARLKGEVRYEQLLQDKNFMAAPREKKLRYLSEVFIPSIDPAFKSAPLEKQEAYLNQVVMPKFEQAPALDAISPTPIDTTPPKPPANLTGQVQQNVFIPGDYAHPMIRAQQEATAQRNRAWLNSQPTGLGGATLISPLDPNKMYSPLDRIGHVVAGAAGGILKGVLPIEEIDNPMDPSRPLDSYYQMDPWGQTAETVTLVPTALGANILGALFTGGTYNAAYGGISALEANRMAQEQALRSGQYDAFRNIRNAQVPSVLANTAYGFGLAKIPGFVGKTPATKIGTGVAMGYPQDIADRMLMQYAQTGGIDPSQIDYFPGLNTLLGAAIPAGQHYLPKMAKGMQNRPWTAAEMKALLQEKLKGNPDPPIGIHQIRKEVKGRIVHQGEGSQPTIEIQPENIPKNIPKKQGEIFQQEGQAKPLEGRVTHATQEPQRPPGRPAPQESQQAQPSPDTAGVLPSDSQSQGKGKQIDKGQAQEAEPVIYSIDEPVPTEKVNMDESPDSGRATLDGPATGKRAELANDSVRSEDVEGLQRAGGSERGPEKLPGQAEAGAPARPASKSAQRLTEQVSIFKSPKNTVEAKKAAMEIERLAKEVSMEEFEAAMKKLSQEELDRLGREYGC